MFYQIFLSPQVKRWVIITYEHGIYELPNDLRLDLRKLGDIRKVSVGPTPYEPAKLRGPHKTLCGSGSQSPRH